MRKSRTAWGYLFLATSKFMLETCEVPLNLTLKVMAFWEGSPYFLVHQVSIISISFIMGIMKKAE